MKTVALCCSSFLLFLCPSLCPSPPSLSPLPLCLPSFSPPVTPWPGHFLHPALMGHLLGNGGRRVSHSINLFSPLQPRLWSQKVTRKWGQAWVFDVGLSAGAKVVRLREGEWVPGGSVSRVRGQVSPGHPGMVCISWASVSPKARPDSKSSPGQFLEHSPCVRCNSSAHQEEG